MEEKKQWLTGTGAAHAEHPAQHSTRGRLEGLSHKRGYKARSYVGVGGFFALFIGFDRLLTFIQGTRRG